VLKELNGLYGAGETFWRVESDLCAVLVGAVHAHNSTVQRLLQVSGFPAYRRASGLCAFLPGRDHDGRPGC
jgi:hypothetical protein